MSNRDDDITINIPGEVTASDTHDDVRTTSRAERYASIEWKIVADVLAESVAYHRYRTRHDRASCLQCKALKVYDAAINAALEGER